jgi:hypothetical protein
MLNLVFSFCDIKPSTFELYLYLQLAALCMQASHIYWHNVLITPSRQPLNLTQGDKMVVEPLWKQ